MRGSAWQAMRLSATTTFSTTCLTAATRLHHYTPHTHLPHTRTRRCIHHCPHTAHAPLPTTTTARCCLHTLHCTVHCTCHCTHAHTAHAPHTTRSLPPHTGFAHTTRAGTRCLHYTNQCALQVHANTRTAALAACCAPAAFLFLYALRGAARLTARALAAADRQTPTRLPSRATLPCIAALPPRTRHALPAYYLLHLPVVAHGPDHTWNRCYFTCYPLPTSRLPHMTPRLDCPLPSPYTIIHTTPCRGWDLGSAGSAADSTCQYTGPPTFAG